MEADLKLICEGCKIKSDMVQSVIDIYRNVLVRAQNESIKLEQVSPYVDTLAVYTIPKMISRVLQNTWEVRLSLTKHSMGLSKC
jgi:hypothetical protein